MLKLKSNILQIVGEDPNPGFSWLPPAVKHATHIKLTDNEATVTKKMSFVGEAAERSHAHRLIDCLLDTKIVALGDKIAQARKITLVGTKENPTTAYVRMQYATPPRSLLSLTRSLPNYCST
jgi:hypothetical protein